MNVQLLECHGPGVSLASTKETYCRVHAAVVLHEPPFTNYSMEAGTETGEEASEPKGIETAIEELVGLSGIVGSDAFANFGSRPLSNW